MSVVFGNSMSNGVSQGDSNKDFESSTSNDVAVDLSFGDIDSENCKILAPKIEKRLQTLLGQHNRIAKAARHRPRQGCGRRPFAAAAFCQQKVVRFQPANKLSEDSLLSFLLAEGLPFPI